MFRFTFFSGHFLLMVSNFNQVYQFFDVLITFHQECKFSIIRKIKYCSDEWFKGKHSLTPNKIQRAAGFQKEYSRHSQPSLYDLISYSFEYTFSFFWIYVLWKYLLVNESLFPPSHDPFRQGNQRASVSSPFSRGLAWDWRNCLSFLLELFYVALTLLPFYS